MRVLVAALLGLLAWGAVDPANSVRAKLRLLQSGKARAGSVVSFTPGELTSYARSELPAVVPEGVREPRIELGNGRATGYALIDFLRIRHGQGAETPWLIGKLIEGEKPVKVEARMRSGGGRATVFLQRVEISGLAVSGSTLDFLIRNFFRPLFPDAKINEPFELQDRVERIEVSPAAARVILRP